MNSYQGQTDHDIDQEGLRDTQEEAERETAGWSSRSDLSSLPDDQIEAGSPLSQMLAPLMTRAGLAEVIDPPDEPDPHRPAITKGSAACQDCGGDCVDITWTETVTRSATVHRSELAEAVAAAGQDDDGHPMPDDLSTLYGDPWKHGDLAALLGELSEDEQVDLHLDTDNAEITSITPAG
jgi:hypothetical protein